jgi:hypothetical protein
MAFSRTGENFQTDAWLVHLYNGVPAERFPGGQMRIMKAGTCFVITSVVAILGFFLTVGSPDTAPPVLYCKGLVIGFSLFIVGIWVSQAIFLSDWSDEGKREFGILRNHILQSGEYMGSPEEAQEYILSFMSSVKSISNTHIKPWSPDREMQTSVSPVTHDSYNKAVHDLIYRRGGTVSDVVSEAYVEYFKNIRLDSAEGTQPSNKYTLCSVATEFRFVNYMILEYDDGAKDVFFGWLFDAKFPANGNVFRSSDPRLVLFYERHFLSLVSNAKSVALKPRPLAPQG